MVAERHPGYLPVDAVVLRDHHLADVMHPVHRPGRTPFHAERVPLREWAYRREVLVSATPIERAGAAYVFELWRTVVTTWLEGRASDGTCYVTPPRERPARLTARRRV